MLRESSGLSARNPNPCPPQDVIRLGGLRKRLEKKKVNLLVQFEVKDSNDLGRGGGNALRMLKLRDLHVV